MSSSSAPLSCGEQKREEKDFSTIRNASPTSGKTQASPAGEIVQELVPVVKKKSRSRKQRSTEEIQIVFLPPSYARRLGDKEESGKLICRLNGVETAASIRYEDSAKNKKRTRVYNEGDILVGLPTLSGSAAFRDRLADRIVERLKTKTHGEMVRYEEIRTALKGKKVLYPEYWEFKSPINSKELKSVCFKVLDTRQEWFRDWIKAIVLAVSKHFAQQQAAATLDAIKARLDRQMCNSLPQTCLIRRDDIVTGPPEFKQLILCSFPDKQQKYRDFVMEAGACDSKSRPQTYFSDDRVFQVKSSADSLWFQHFDGCSTSTCLFSKYERLLVCRRDARSARNTRKRKQPPASSNDKTEAKSCKTSGTFREDTGSALQMLINAASKRLDHRDSSVGRDRRSNAASTLDMRSKKMDQETRTKSGDVKDRSSSDVSRINGLDGVAEVEQSNPLSTESSQEVEGKSCAEVNSWREMGDSDNVPRRRSKPMRPVKWPMAESAMVELLSKPEYRNATLDVKQDLAREIGKELGMGTAFKASLTWIRDVEKRNLKQIEAGHHGANGSVNRCEDLQTHNPTWLINEAQNLRYETYDFKAALDLLRQAVVSLQMNSSTSDNPECARVFNMIGSINHDLGEMENAIMNYRQALTIAERFLPNSPVAASINCNMGRLQLDQGHTDLASAHFRKALAMQERSAPNSLEVASTLDKIGYLSSLQGATEEALEHLHRASAIQELLAPVSLDIACTFGHIGNVRQEQGQLELAMSYYQRALILQEHLAPESLDVAFCYTNIARLQLDRGCLNEAISHQKRAIGIQERLAPGSLALATSFDNFGCIEYEQGNIEAAMSYQERALETRKRLVPLSLDMASSKDNLGKIKVEQGLLESAFTMLVDALSIRSRIAPDSMKVSMSLENMGKAFSAQGKFDHAMEYYQRAVAIQEQLAPNSLYIASNFVNIGVLHQKQHDSEAALQHYMRAKAIQEMLAPSSLALASTYCHLGNVYEVQNKPDASMTTYERALVLQERLVPKSAVVTSTRSIMTTLEARARRLEQ